MSNSSAMSMQELELESAELLPGRETLCVPTWTPHGVGVTQIGDSAQAGFINVSLLNGSLNGSLNGLLNGSLNGLLGGL